MAAAVAECGVQELSRIPFLRGVGTFGTPLIDIAFQHGYCSLVRVPSNTTLGAQDGPLAWGRGFGSPAIHDSRIFFMWNPQPGFSLPFEQQSRGCRVHYETGIVRVPKSDWHADMANVSGIGSNTEFGMNLWWGGNFNQYTGGGGPPPPRGDATPGYPFGVETALDEDFFAINSQFQPVLNFGTIAVRNDHLYTCPILTGPELGPYLFIQNTNTGSYEIPATYANAKIPDGTLLFQINGGFWGVGKSTAQGHDSYFVNMPDTPGMMSYFKYWVDPAGWTGADEDPVQPALITHGWATSMNYRLINNSGTTATQSQRFESNAGNANFAYRNTGGLVPQGPDIPVTHTWDWQGGGCSGPPDFAVHLRFLVPGRVSSTGTMAQGFSGGPGFG